LNTRIRRKPFPISRIQDLLLKLEGFQYATSLDHNMGYYHIELTPFSKSLCTILLPFGQYEYQRLPMGLCKSPDILQEKMSNLVDYLDFCRAYIDDLLIITRGSWEQHLLQLEVLFQRSEKAGLKVNATKSFFGKSEFEYLGFWITSEGIQPLPKKVQAILQITEPKTKKELRRYIGMISYYRDMWIRRSEILTPLTKLVSKTYNWVWADEQQKAFDMIKKLLSRETMLSYPDFSQTFGIHTDANHFHLGAAISQSLRPIVFYSRKLNPAQTRYTTNEHELPAIVETLKEFCNILLGHRIRVYTDHKNLTYTNFNTECVLRWSLFLEELGPDLTYIKVDALCCLGITPATYPTIDILLVSKTEIFGQTQDDASFEVFPVQFVIS
jgi:RNase H-like domain found in reverse transcriptase/Reverse transcriptase (RNA-dependent DNA polymerase)